MSPHTPILSVPSPAHYRSGPHDLIGLSTHGQEMNGSMSVERREVEGIGKRHTSTHWLYRRLSVPWPTCDGEEDDLDNSRRRNRTTESPQSGTAPHTLARPSLQSPMAIQSQISYPHVNSTQPTYHPVMVVTSIEQDPDAERIRGGGIRCCGFTIAGPQGRKEGIQIAHPNQNGQSQSKPPTTITIETEPTMQETISRPMSQSQGVSRSRAQSHSSPKPVPSAPSGTRSRRPSHAQAADGAQEPSQRAPRSRTPSQVAEPRPRAQSGAKEPRSRAGSMSQSRSRANSRAGQPDSARPRLDSRHFSSAAPTLPPVPVTPINLGYP